MNKNDLRTEIVVARYFTLLFLMTLMIAFSNGKIKSSTSGFSMKPTIKVWDFNLDNILNILFSITRCLK